VALPRQPPEAPDQKDQVVTSPAVFLDRDGVLVIPEFRHGRSFAPKRLEDLKFYPDAASALKRLRAAGYRLVVVTNQPDVGNGSIAREVVNEMHARLRATMPVDAIMACFHSQSEDCTCRKPRPGMLIDAAKEFQIDLTTSYMVGDRASDVEAGRAAGCRTVFIDLDYREEEHPAATVTVRSIAEAADFILGVEQKG
jgi:D-glycero-D-manno-heptose 1,7-bisphosphate phosphatase